VELLLLQTEDRRPCAPQSARLGRIVSDPGIDVLLVEDDRRLAELTATYLTQNGLRVAVEARGDGHLNASPRSIPAWCCSI